MTRIDFYILSEEARTSREQFACRLAEKIYQLGQRVYIHTSTPQQAEAMDKLLWTFKENSFIPHAIDGAAPDPETALLIGHSAELADHNHAQSHEVLINLAQEIPLFFSSFKRVAEIVGNDETNKKSGRERYRFYRDRGYTLENHNIN